MNPSTPARLRVAVIVGSTRPARQGLAVAEWVCRDSPDDLDLVIVDLAEVDLPLLAEQAPAAFGDYRLASTQRWSKLVGGFDAFVLVTPEYNHSTSAALKNALDHLYAEWADKPVAFVGYGLEGGQRAVEHLRLVTAELAMAGVRPQVSISLMSDYRDGRLEPRAFQVEHRARMLTELARWARAFRSLRDQAADPDWVGAGNHALEDLVEDLQAGLDARDADRYDRRFAEDVLWGSPYGATLQGIDSVNDAHRYLMSVASAPASRYEIVQSLVPVPGTVVAHVRRRALDFGDDAGFSEMALYVLVQRDGRWELVAGQNTPIAPTKPSHPVAGAGQ